VIRTSLTRKSHICRWGRGIEANRLIGTGKIRDADSNQLHCSDDDRQKIVFMKKNDQGYCLRDVKNEVGGQKEKNRPKSVTHAGETERGSRSSRENKNRDEAKRMQQGRKNLKLAEGRMKAWRRGTVQAT